MTYMSDLTPGEQSFCKAIRNKDRALRSFLEANNLIDPVAANDWLRYLSGVKRALGNLNNDVGFVATLLVKDYLKRRFAIRDFDAAGKRQGAPGIDIEAWTAQGDSVIGELKTTIPYQPGFGAAQRTAILKDIARLAASTARHRFMFVIDPESFQTLCGKGFAARAPGVEVVDLVTNRSFIFE
jgi:hypothetical protein